LSKKQYFLSLRTRLILFIFLIAFAPLMTVTFISWRYTEKLAEDILYSHLNSITQNKSKAIVRWIIERIADVRIMADSKALYSMNAQEIDKHIESMKTHYLDYKRTLFVDSQGNTIADTLNKQENYRNKDWFQDAMNQGEYISDAFLDKDELMFLIAVAVNKDRRPIGVLCEFVGLQYLNDFASDITLGESGKSYLVNKNGLIIAHEDKNRILGNKIIDLELLMLPSEESKKLKVYQNYLGVEVMGVQTWINQQKMAKFVLPQWLLIAEQETSEIFAEINKYKIGIIILFLFLFCVVILEGFLISWSIVRPIRKLVDATSSIAKGNFSEQLEIDRMDEIGRLTDAFNNMAKRLRDYYDKLENGIISTRGELEKVSDELKKSKKVLDRSEKLVSLGQISAGMAHEIRTPLTSIKLFIQTLEATLLPDDETLDDFAIIKKEIERMEDIINRFLDFARPAEPKFESVNINQILSEAINLIKTRIKNEIVLKTKYEKISSISGDNNQLRQVFLNMLINAIEAMPNGGSITIATNIITLSDSQKRLLKITIADTGYGIKPDLIKYIFDPFFTTKDLGTGMGLAIAFTVIEQHGGMIEVQSKPSQGTTFMIYLPLI
jgi:two-component system NtrC family sensor kinase